MTHEDVKALIPVQVQDQIIKGMTESSVAMKLFKKLPNMSSNMMQMPVLDLLPITYWVNEERNEGRKGITTMKWKNKYLIVAELATIMVIKINDLNDTGRNIWGEVLPNAAADMGKQFDKAVFLGTNKPNGYREDLITSIINAGGLIVPEQNETLYSQIDRAMTKVEESGYEVTGLVGGVDLKSKFRNMLDTTGQPISGTEIGNLPRTFVRNGAWDKTKAVMIVGDMQEAVYAIREDVDYKILTEGVIQDPETGTILHNLAQEDKVAIRITMRLGWQIPNPVNMLEGDEAVRFPFAAIQGSAGVTTQNVTFTVTDSSSDPVEGVDIIVEDVIKHTNASGQAVVKLQAGTHAFLVVKGKNKRPGKVTVASSAVSVAVENF